MSLPWSFKKKLRLSYRANGMECQSVALALICIFSRLVGGVKGPESFTSHGVKSESGPTCSKVRSKRLEGEE
jgi:hypothetical protein